MAETPDKKIFRSRGGGTAMRSRGFLSHGQVRTAPGGGEAAGAGEIAQHRSRGSRPTATNCDGKPKALSTAPGIKPYKLDDK